jgi:hypothetical protein
LTTSCGERVIQLAVLDPLLYGAARAFDYLDFRGQDMLDKVGDGILQYGLSEGYFEKSNDPHQFAGNLVNFFLENGYLSNASVKQEGDTFDIEMSNWKYLPVMRKLRNRHSYLLTCPLCIANHSIIKSVGGVTERVREDISSDGTYTVKIRAIPGTKDVANSAIPIEKADLNGVRLGNQLNETIGRRAFESVLYGLAYGFEFLGAQAQLLLDNVGTGMIEFIQEESKLSFPREPEDSLGVLSTFMSKGGLADTIRVHASNSEVRVDFDNSSYLPVLKRLMQEGRQLVSCPFTLAARSLIKMGGSSVREMTWEIEGRNTRLLMPIVDVNKQEFNEEAISRIMDQL